VRDGPIRVLLAADTLFGGFHPRTGSDIDDWAASLGLLAEEEFEYLSVGHAHAPLIADAGRVVAEARLQLGVYFNPWFRPFHLEFSHP
jgi:hydroxyacylglutathione hydrolase